MNYKLIAKNILTQYNIDVKILDKYDELHRFYHNWNHIEYMFQIAMKEDIKLSDELILAIIFHDIIYDPKFKDNEEQSAELFYSLIKNDEIKQAILDTKTHKNISSELSKQLCYLDLHNIYNDFEVFYNNSYNVFKEYQFVDFSIYKPKRREFLELYHVDPMYIKAVDVFKPNIGIYAGSFNPFHKGHYDILTKAEKIFDKVIIARGINPEKSNAFCELPEKISHRQIETYDGLLTDFIEILDYDVTLIRGLRNATDLQYELTQFQYLQDLKPDIKVISLFSDKQYEHISSSAIRMLEKYGKSNNYLI